MTVETNKNSESPGKMPGSCNISAGTWQNAKYSIIVPFYNAEKWIGRCADSLTQHEGALPLHSNMHPTMKPIKLIGRFIINSSRPGDPVADIFGGSGSTMIAAEQLDRKCYMMELDPHYCDVIINRWEEFTGKKVKLIEK